MGLGRRVARRLHSTAGIDPQDQTTYAPGDRVVVVEGFPGVIDDVQTGQYPQMEVYTVTLDAGMGGGEYSAEELTRVGHEAAQDGRYEPPTASVRVDADLDIHSAAEDYPELSEVLVDRPPLAHSLTASKMAAGKCSACGGSGEQGNGHECYICDGSGDADAEAEGRALGIDNSNPENGLPVGVDLASTAGRFVVTDATGKQIAGPFSNSDLGRPYVEADPTRSIQVVPDQDFQTAFATLHTASNTYTVVGPIGEMNRTDWELHIKGCGDLSQPKYHRYISGAIDIDADSAQQAAEFWIDEELQEMGYSVDEHVKVFPCAKRGVPEEAKPVKPLDPSICPGTGQPFPPDNGPGRRLYLPCPVCGVGLGTGRGVVPRHKRKAEFVYGEITVGEYPDTKIEKHIAKQDQQALCGAGRVSYSKPMKTEPVRGTCQECIDLWTSAGEQETREASILDVEGKGLVDWFADKTNFTPGNNWSYDWCRFRKNQRCMYPKQLDAEGTRQAGYAVWLPEDRGYCPRDSWDDQKVCPAPSEPGPRSGEPGAKPDATVPWSEGGQRLQGQGSVTPVEITKKARGGINVAQVCKFCDKDATKAFVWAEGMAYIPACDDHHDKARSVIESDNNDEVLSEKDLPARTAVSGVGGSFPAEEPGDIGVLCAYCFGEGTGGVLAVERAQGVCGKCKGLGFLDMRMTFGGSLKVEADNEWGFHFHAAWKDVQAKATRIRSDGYVRIISSTGLIVTAEVRGDTNLYQTSIMRTPGSKNVAMWECGCAWSTYSWARSGRWKKYEGRMCSHALAVVYEAQAREMFGNAITEDQTAPQWRNDPTIPVVRPGDNRTKPTPWRVGSIEEHPEPHEVSIEGSLAISLADAIQAHGAFGGGGLRALVRGVIRKVIDVLPGGRAVVDGIGEVPAVDVINPKYHPTRGIDDFHPRTAAAKFVKAWDGYDVTLTNGRTYMVRKVDDPTPDFPGPWWSLVASDVNFTVQKGDQMTPDYFLTLRDLKERVEEYEHEDDEGWIASKFASATEADMDGAMIALVPPKDVLEALAREGGEPIENMHFTVVYLGKRQDLDEGRLEAMVESFALTSKPLTGRIGGYGVFHNEDAQVLVALGDFPGLGAWRADLVSRLGEAGFEIPSDHDFTPHMTIAYVADGDADVPTALPDGLPAEITFDSFALVYGTEWVTYEMGNHEPIMGEDRSQKAAAWSGSGPATFPCPNCQQQIVHPPRNTSEEFTPTEMVEKGYTNLVAGYEETPTCPTCGFEFDRIPSREGSKIASRFTFKVVTGSGIEDVADMAQAMIRSNGGHDAFIERESEDGTVIIATSEAMEAWWIADGEPRLGQLPITGLRFEAAYRGSNYDPGATDDVDLYTAGYESGLEHGFGGGPGGMGEYFGRGAFDGDMDMEGYLWEQTQGALNDEFLFEADAHTTPSWPKGEESAIWDGSDKSMHKADTPEGGEHIGPKDECALCTSKTATNDEARDWDMDPALRDDESWLLDSEALALGTPERAVWDREHEDSITAMKHDEPEPALPVTDGAEDDDEDSRDHLRPEAHTTGPGGLDITALQPAWLGGAGDSGASRVAQHRAANSEIAEMAKAFLAEGPEALVKAGMKTFSPAEQQAIINEGSSERAGNLDRLDLTGTHYGPLADALDAEDTEEDWLL